MRLMIINVFHNQSVKPTLARLSAKLTLSLKIGQIIPPRPIEYRIDKKPRTTTKG